MLIYHQHSKGKIGSTISRRKVQVRLSKTKDNVAKQAEQFVEHCLPCEVSQALLQLPQHHPDPVHVQAQAGS